MKKKAIALTLALSACLLMYGATVTTIAQLPDGSGVFTIANHDQINTNATSANTNFANLNAVLGAAGASPSGTGNLCLTTSCALTTPSLINPVITGPAPVACGATCSPTAGQLILMNLAAGATVTLPTSAGTGNVIRMRVTTATTSAAEKVLLTTTADVIIGTAIGENAGAAKIFVGNASTYHSLQMPFSGSQPSGGFIGDQITCTDIAAGTWACDINYQAGATPTTPYSAATT